MATKIEHKQIQMINQNEKSMFLKVIQFYQGLIGLEFRLGFRNKTRVSFRASYLVTDTRLNACLH